MSTVIRIDSTRRTTSIARVVSEDTVETLQRLLDLAKNGEVIGVAYVAMLPRRQFETHSAGECLRNPVFSAGMVSHLLLDLQLQARGAE